MISRRNESVYRRPVKKHRFIVSIKPSGVAVEDKIGKAALVSDPVKIQ